MRLSAPTGRTFGLAVVALIVGIVLRSGWIGLDVSPDVTYWLTAAGGILLALGVIFNRI